MKAAAFFWVLLLCTNNASAQYAERECGCTVSQLWLDVVVVMDVSKGMGAAGATQVVADLASVFASVNISQAIGQTTRIGVVTYASRAHTAHSLAYFTSTDQFMNEIWNVIPNTFTDSGSNLKLGLEQAGSVLASGRSSGKRNNVKQVVIVYASDYNEDGASNPVSTATQLKENGISIISVAFNQGGSAKVLAGLKNIATPGMFFVNADNYLVNDVQKACCTANCYCPLSWTRYTTSDHAYGVCVKFGEIDSSWLPAKLSCQHLYPNAYLASEFTQEKHLFNAAHAKKDATASSPYSFHIGLSYSSSMKQFVWEQPVGQAQLPLNNSTYTNGWNPGYPSATSNQPNQGCVLNMQSGVKFNLGWQDENCYSINKRYLCQVNSCDTDNYCSA